MKSTGARLFKALISRCSSDMQGRSHGVYGQSQSPATATDANQGDHAPYLPRTPREYLVVYLLPVPLNHIFSRRGKKLVDIPPDNQH